MQKPRVDAAAAKAFLERILGAPVSEVEPILSGEWSQAFSLRYGEDLRIARFGATADRAPTRRGARPCSTRPTIARAIAFTAGEQRSGVSPEQKRSSCREPANSNRCSSNLPSHDT